jgi:hypothetical protein
MTRVQERIDIQKQSKHDMKMQATTFVCKSLENVRGRK